MAEDPNLLLSIRILNNNEIDSHIRIDMDWDRRAVDVLLNIVLQRSRFRRALFDRIVEDEEYRNEVQTRISNRQSSIG